MSKKFKIPSINIRSHLSSLFHSFMERKYECESSRMSMYDNLDDEELLWMMHQQGYFVRGIDDMDEDFDYGNFYDNDDSDVIWPPKSEKSKHEKRSKKEDDAYVEFWEKETKRGKRKHSKRKKARLIDINCPYSGNEDEPDEVGYSHYEEIDDGDDDGILNGKEIYYYPDYHEKDNRLEFSTLKSFCDFCDDNGYDVPEHVANDIMYRRISHTCLRPDAREYGMYEIMAEDSYGTMFYEVCDSSELGG